MAERGNAVGDKGGGRAFIGSFTSAGGRGIIAADVDGRTGALTETGFSEAVADPSYLALATGSGGPVLYAVSETAQGAVAAFDISGPAPHTGTRAPIGRGDGPSASKAPTAPSAVSETA